MLIYAAIGVVISRSTVTFREGRGKICISDVDEKKKLVAARLEPGQQITRDDFTTSNPCWSSRVQLQQGQHYTVWIEMTDPPFFDQTLMTDIAGFEDISWRHLLALPIRRWWSADWFQPIARVGNTGIDAWPLVSADGDTAIPTGQDAAGNPMPKLFYEYIGKQAKDGTFPDQSDSYAPRLKELKSRQDNNEDPSRLDIDRPIPQGELEAAKKIRAKYVLRKSYVSNFSARSDGELFLYVNDAIAAIPFGSTIKWFYENNTGKAKVTIKHQASPPP